MKESKKCPKCNKGSVYYVDNIPEMGDYLTVNELKLGLKKELWFGRDGGVLTAYVCSECGYTEFYLKNPKELLEANSDQVKKWS